QLQQGDEDYLNSQLTGAMTVTGRRTNVTLSGSVYQRTYEVSGNKEDGYDLSLNFTRQLGSNFSASAGGSWSQEKASFLGDSDYYDVRFALTRSLSKRTSASLNISHHERDSNAANNSYTENRIGISLTSSFL
ncbi:MAG: outer membrane beta-barrel protein, partial [Gammaproteobacteria bacterium]|nr:outer membrane beta-barrel protein [Gammaproteobacteria bacterium]